jgi:KDO2-lipid IV(A) lauroyltransferase
MNSFLNRLVVVFCRLIARLPFWVIWGLADLFYVVIFYIVRYRRKVVHQNLVNSFPEKSPKEIRRITKRYYHHLSDIGLETIKFSRMTEKQIDDRLKVHGYEIYEEYFQQGKSIIVLGMHYNNWEWSGAMQRFIKSQFLVVYNQLRDSNDFERFMIETRGRFGAQSVPINLAPRVALNLNHAERSGSLMLASDQTPPRNSQFWTTFLNQETAFFPGAMKIAQKTNQPVIMHHTRKTGRGRYEVFHYKLIEEPSKVAPEDIMMAYVNKLEKIIQEEPEYWLWSHRRWKHKRPENIQLYERKA